MSICVCVYVCVRNMETMLGLVSLIALLSVMSGLTRMSLSPGWDPGQCEWRKG